MVRGGLRVTQSIDPYRADHANRGYSCIYWDSEWREGWADEPRRTQVAAEKT